MKLASSITALSCLALGALGLAMPADNYLEKRQIVTPSWKVEVSPGGPTVVLNGTIQQVRAELLKLNPNWDNDYPSTLSNTTALEKRGRNNHFIKFEGAGYLCGAPFDYANTAMIWEGVDYLRRVRGHPVSDGGHGICSRVSCSWASAIYWCNDDPNVKILESYGSIADGAEFLITYCALPTGTSVVAGQVFHKTNWNVIVRADLNHC